MSLGKTCAGPRFVRQIRAGPIFDRLGLGGWSAELVVPAYWVTSQQCGFPATVSAVCGCRNRSSWVIDDDHDDNNNDCKRSRNFRSRALGRNVSSRFCCREC